MRRKDKEINDNKEIESILKKGILCTVAFSDGHVPYLVTVNYGYQDGAIFFHSAKEGRKIDLISKNPKVCFQVVIDTELTEGEKACSDFSMKYRSVVGYGKISVLENVEEKKAGLNIMMLQHSGRGDWEFGKNSLAETAVIKIEIEEMTAKQSV